MTRALRSPVRAGSGLVRIRFPELFQSQPRLFTANERILSHLEQLLAFIVRQSLSLARNLTDSP